MRLYHGSPVPDLTCLKPFMSKHDKPYVYLTDNETLSILYAHNPLPRPHAWFSYYFKDGQLHYDEYFPDAMRVIYGGQSGCVYTCLCRDDLPTLDKMNWIYLSQEPVQTAECRCFPDLYEELAARVDAGRIILHRHDELCAAEQDWIRRTVLKEIDQYGLRLHPDDPYARFLHEHFPELI